MPTREQQNLAAYLWHNQGRRGRKMQWLDFSSKGDAERALQAIRGNYPHLPDLGKASVKQIGPNHWQFGLSHAQWDQVVSRQHPSTTSMRSPQKAGETITAYG